MVTIATFTNKHTRISGFGFFDPVNRGTKQYEHILTCTASCSKNNIININNVKRHIHPIFIYLGLGQHILSTLVQIVSFSCEQEMVRRSAIHYSVSAENV